MNIAAISAQSATYSPPAAKVAQPPPPPPPAAAKNDGDGDSDKGGVDIRV